MEEEKEHFKTIENSTLLYPYNGRSLNLIDKFYIFGYNYVTLKKILEDKNLQIPEENINSEGLGFFQIEEEPSILYEITHDYNKHLVEPDIIKKFIFPNGLSIGFREEINDANIRPSLSFSQKNNSFGFDKNNFAKIDFSEDTTGCPKNTRSVFSSSPLEGKNSRKCQNGFAFTFYKKLLRKIEIRGKNYIIYIPHTFCIISEFPFYISYEKLFKCIMKMFFQRNIYIPIELLLYKIVLLTPSPINTDVIIDLSLMCNQKKIYSIIKKINNNNNDKYSNTKRTRSEIPKFNYIKGAMTFQNIANDISQDDFVKVEETDMELFEDVKQKVPVNPLEYKIKFKYLSGYPLLQYNVAKVLFHTLSLEDIITVFIFTFLESNIIFFSEDNEYLTLTINSYANFNFPLNDAEYFYNIGAISLNASKNDDEFGIKGISSIVAINNEYVNDYLSVTNRIDEHIVVDLDHKNIMVKKAKNNHCYFKIINLIKDICGGNNNNINMKGTNFYHAVTNLYLRLIEIYNKKEIYLTEDFIDFNESCVDSIEELNISIQEAFYECSIILSLYFYENLIIIEDENKRKKKIEENNNSMIIEYNKKYQKEGKYKEEELIIIDELFGTMKFRGSLTQFVMCHNPIDLYKIPLTFTDEFLSVFSKLKFKKNNLNNRYFELIDKLYLTKKLDEIETMDFSSDIKKYVKNFKVQFDNEIEDMGKKWFNHDFTSIVKVIGNQGTKVLKYQTFELDDRILLRYIHIINNLTQGKYLILISDNFLKEENIINEISMTEVETRVEDFCLEKQYLTNKDLFSSNMIILFAICLKYFPKNFECDTYLSIMLQSFKIFRKYISLLLQIIYKTYKQSLEEKNYIMLERMKFCFFKCFNYIRTHYLIPNENLMYIINKFLKLLIEEEKNIHKENEENKENNLNNKELDFSITNRNLYIFNNFSPFQFYKEQDIIKRVNKEQIKPFKINEGQQKEIIPYIRFIKNKNEKIESEFISQKDLYKQLSIEYNKYLENLDLDELDKKTIIDSCLNLFVFIRNNEQFEDSDDLMKIMENIFHIFINNE